MKSMIKLINVILSFTGCKLSRTKRRSIFQKPNRRTGNNDVVLPNYDVDCIIDVGVADGTPWLYNQFATQPLILVEPLNVVPQLLELLVDRKYEMYECAAGSCESEATINFDKTYPGLSSIFDRTKLAQWENSVIEKRTVPVKTIDQIVSETQFRVKTFGLKIDTEGFELEVLKGAKETLKKCRFVVCEASIEKRFENSYNFSELIVYMSQQNFILVKVLRFGVDTNNVTRLADVLFERIPWQNNDSL